MTILRFAREDRGSVAPLFSIVCVTLLVSSGVALDHGRAVNAKVDLQTAADSAALAGAGLADTDEDERIAIAEKVFAENTKLTPPPAPSVSIEAGAVVVSVNATVETTLMKLAGVENVPVTVKSSALLMTEQLPCILALEPAAIGITVNSDSGLVASCGVHVNSDNNEALLANSDSHVTATSVCVHGTARLNSSSSATPAPTEDCPVLSDPLATLPEPDTASDPCNFTDYTVTSGASAAMSPGVYCGVTTINASSSATMQPGLYVFRGGEFVINSNSTVTGAGVMFYFESGRLNVNSQSPLNISAPASGPYQGILVFQSRSAPPAGPFIVNSNSATRIAGTVYLPAGALELNSQSTANSLASYTVIVARQLTLNSMGTLYINSDYAAGPPLPPLLKGLKGGQFARLIE